jgi:hypothetical protein
MRDLRLYIKRLAARTPGPLRRFAKRFLAPEAFSDWLYAAQSRAKKRFRKKRAAKKHARTKPAPIPTAQKVHAPIQTAQKPRQPMAVSSPPSAARRLEKCIFAGFRRATADRLERYKVSRDSQLVADAAWGLALWHGSVGDYSKALDHLTLRRLADPRSGSQLSHHILEIEALLRLGRGDDAEAVLRVAGSRRGTSHQLCFLAANATTLRTDLAQSERDRLRLDWLNKPLISSGLSPLNIKDSARPLAFDNFTAETSPYPRSGDAKVSVLMPAYDAQDTIAVAIESVLNQTWSNLELIVVDDGSGDHTWEVLQSFAARDPRVLVLRHEQNRGAYAARNTALRHATGDLVTVNDADDGCIPSGSLFRSLICSTRVTY